MPCLPGFLPVMNEVHAGGVIGGRLDSSLPDTPAFTNFARFGMPPSAIHGRMSVHVAASNPMIITFGSFFIFAGRLYRLCVCGLRKILVERRCWNQIIYTRATSASQSRQTENQ